MGDYRLTPISTGTGRMTEWRAFPDEDLASICPACGSAIDYCQGHGEIGDPAGYAALEMHDTDNHSQCHPKAECRENRAPSWSEIRRRFDEYLDETEGTVTIHGFDYSVSTAFARVNPIDYRQTFNMWCDSEGLDTDDFVGPVDMP